MPPKTVSIARSHLSLILIHYLTNAKKIVLLFTTQTVLHLKRIYLQKNIMYSAVTVHFEVRITL